MMTQLSFFQIAATKQIIAQPITVFKRRDSDCLLNFHHRISLPNASIPTPFSANGILLKQGSLLIILHSTNRGCSNRPVGGAQGTSQQQKWAKPWTASSVVLLSHSSLGLLLGTGLEGEDRHLAMNWHNHLKSISPRQPPCPPACLRQIWSTTSDQKEYKEHLCMLACHYIHLFNANVLWNKLM